MRLASRSGMATDRLTTTLGIAGLNCSWAARRMRKQKRCKANQRTFVRLAATSLPSATRVALLRGPPCTDWQYRARADARAVAAGSQPFTPRSSSTTKSDGERAAPAQLVTTVV